MPVTEERFIKKIREIDTDVIVLDLEDSILNCRKKNARLLLKNIFNNAAQKDKIFVRVNNINTQYFKDDIKTCEELGIANVIYPKLSSISELNEVINQLNSTNSNHILIPIIETIEGIENCESIISHENIIITIFGSEDYLADLGVMDRDISYKNVFLTQAINKIAFASLKYKKPFIDCAAPFYFNSDLLKFRSECQFAADMGAIGKLAIHPNQVKIINEIYSNQQNKILDKAESVTEILLKMKNDNKAVISSDHTLVGIPEIKKLISILSYYKYNKELTKLNGLLNELLLEKE